MKNQVETIQNGGSHKKRRLILYAYILLFVMIVSVTATYTWLSLSRTPVVNNLSMYVTSHAGLELALTPDSEQWGSKVSYVDMATESFPLRPITWSEKEGRFYAARYGVDGRLTGKWVPLSDEQNANRNDHDSYYSIGTFYAKASQDTTVSLAQSVQMNEGISGAGTYLVGAPIWDDTTISHKNAGNGAENAIRIGIHVTLLDPNDRPLENTATFFIYEPNCDYHADGQVGYVNTPSIDGDESLVPAEKLILQKHSTWTEVVPVENGVQTYTIGEFETPTKLFSLKEKQKARIKLYLWLEGQDVDCTNAIQDARVLANIQFVANTEGESGLRPIR